MEKNISQKLVLEDIPVPAVVGVFRVIADCNAACCELFGYEREELLRRSVSMLYDTRNDFVDNIPVLDNAVGVGENYVRELVMKKADDARFWCRLRARTIGEPRNSARILYCIEDIRRPLESLENKLTRRQRQIVVLMAQGRSSADIAREIGISRRTVEAHRAKLIREVGAKNTAELMNWFASSEGKLFDQVFSPYPGFMAGSYPAYQ